MKLATTVRITLLLALAAAAASTGCMGAYTARARFNPIASDREDLEYARRVRTQVYVSLATSAAVIAYVLFFLYMTALHPLSRLLYVWADAIAICVLLWASAASGGILAPHLPSLAACHTPLCKLSLVGAILKWVEVAMLIGALAAVFITKLRHPLAPWSLSLEHLPATAPADEEDTHLTHPMTMRALYESQLLGSVSLERATGGSAGAATFGRNTLYAVASPSAVALPISQPASNRQSRQSRASKISQRLSRPITYFNSWAEQYAAWAEKEEGSATPTTTTSASASAPEAGPASPALARPPRASRGDRHSYRKSRGYGQI